VVSTGFATVTHSILEHLRHQWDVLVSGINFYGGDHDKPYPVIPARRGSDMWGMDSFAELCGEYQPDVVLINNDWWNVAGFAEQAVSCPIVGYMPVDGGNVNPEDANKLNQLDAAIWYTDFGYREARKAGFRGLKHVVPHGVGASETSQITRAEARRGLGIRIPEDSFLVGNINRNQPRKRLDSTLDIFSKWIQEFGIRDAWLCLHCRRRDEGWDLEQLARYFGVADRVLFTEGEGPLGDVSRRRLDLIYRALDVQITTTSGEGWGLTTMEGMAHGVPQIVPDWAALSEWPRGVVKIPCRERLARPGINTIGALPDGDVLVAELQELYQSEARREQLGQAGKKWVSHSRYQWETVSSLLNAILKDAVATRRRRCRLAS
jgi:glycosyltransferase involved in cell wall biosynthesis